MPPPDTPPPEIRPGRYYTGAELATALRDRLNRRPETLAEIALLLDSTGSAKAQPRSRAAALSAALNPENGTPRAAKVRAEIARRFFGWSLEPGFVRVTAPPDAD